MRTTTKRKMPGENRKLNMLETKRRATGKKQKQQTRKKNTGKTQRGQKRKSYRLSNNGKHLFQVEGEGVLRVSVEKRFHFAEHPVIE